MNKRFIRIMLCLILIVTISCCAVAFFKSDSKAKTSKEHTFENRLIPSNSVIVEHTKYEPEEIAFSDSTITIEAQVLEKDVSRDIGISSFYGANVKIEYKDKDIERSTCILDDQGNLMIGLEEKVDPSEIKQIYINNVPILE